MKGSRSYQKNSYNDVIITEDYLASLTDSSLRNLFLEKRRIINSNRRKKIYSKEDEIEFCYIQRELQYRKRR